MSFRVEYKRASSGPVIFQRHVRFQVEMSQVTPTNGDPNIPIFAVNFILHSGLCLILLLNSLSPVTSHNENGMLWITGNIRRFRRLCEHIQSHLSRRVGPTKGIPPSPRAQRKGRPRESHSSRGMGKGTGRGTGSELSESSSCGSDTSERLRLSPSPSPSHSNTKPRYTSQVCPLSLPWMTSGPFFTLSFLSDRRKRNAIVTLRGLGKPTTVWKTTIIGRIKVKVRVGAKVKGWLMGPKLRDPHSVIHPFMAPGVMEKQRTMCSVLCLDTTVWQYPHHLCFSFSLPFLRLSSAVISVTHSSNAFFF